MPASVQIHFVTRSSFLLHDIPSCLSASIAASAAHTVTMLVMVSMHFHAWSRRDERTLAASDLKPLGGCAHSSRRPHARHRLVPQQQSRPSCIAACVSSQCFCPCDAGPAWRSAIAVELDQCSVFADMIALLGEKLVAHASPNVLVPRLPWPVPGFRHRVIFRRRWASGILRADALVGDLRFGVRRVVDGLS